MGSAANWAIAILASMAPAFAQAVLEFVPDRLLFGAVAVGATSPSQTATVTNRDVVAHQFYLYSEYVICLPSIDGPCNDHGQRDFSFTSDCPGNVVWNEYLATLAPGETCTLTIRFQPTAGGERSGALHTYLPGVSPSAYIAVSGRGEEDARLSQMSTRVQVLGGDDVAIAGFTVTGPAPKLVAVRARGPSLRFRNSLADPFLQLVRSSDRALVASNDDWQRAENAGAILQLGGLAPTEDSESVILAWLDPGAYTAIVSSATLATGVALVEVLEFGSQEARSFGGLSTRGYVGTGDNVMIAGFEVTGTTPLTVRIRARGESLRQAGIGNPLINPVVQVVRASDGELIATLVPPVNFPEPAQTFRLPPGLYTAIVSGAEGSGGTSIVEIISP